jgi:hypothetical protein
MEPPFDPELNDAGAWAVLDAALERVSCGGAAVALTGPSGCGKTTTVQEWCRARGLSLEVLHTFNCDSFRAVIEHLTKAMHWNGMTDTGGLVDRRAVCMDDFDTFCLSNRLFHANLLAWFHKNPVPAGRVWVLCGGDELAERIGKWKRAGVVHAAFAPRSPDAVTGWLARRHPRWAEASWRAGIRDARDNLPRAWAVGDHARVATEHAVLLRTEYENYYIPMHAGDLRQLLEVNPANVWKFYENLGLCINQSPASFVTKLKLMGKFMDALMVWCIREDTDILAATWVQLLKQVPRRKTEQHCELQPPSMLGHALIARKHQHTTRRSPGDV